MNRSLAVLPQASPPPRSPVNVVTTGPDNILRLIVTIK